MGMKHSPTTRQGPARARHAPHRAVAGARGQGGRSRDAQHLVAADVVGATSVGALNLYARTVGPGAALRATSLSDVPVHGHR